MTHTVSWVKLSEERPEETLFYPVWVFTPDGIKLVRYVGDLSDIEKEYFKGRLVDGFLRGGDYFDRVTHWAYLVKPEPPEAD